jgi:SPOR domain
MIETDNRPVGGTARGNRDEWLADLARTASKPDVYAERRETNAYGALGAVQPREAGMTDRYDKAGIGSRENLYGTSVKHVPTSQDDDYYDDYQDAPASKLGAYSDQEEQEAEWTYDEARGFWVDRDGNPYVEAYAEGEEDRYAPADDDYIAPQEEIRRPTRQKSRRGAVSLAALVLVGSIGGGLAYAWKKGGFVGSELPGIGSTPPVIKANTDPVKIKPAQTASSNDQPTREIFDRSSPANSPSNERLVRHEEQPMATVPVRPEGGAPAAGTSAPDASRPVSTSNIVLPTGDTPPASGQTAASNLPEGDAPGGPRSVTTVKVGPDGTAVTSRVPIGGSAPASPSVDVANVVPATPTGNVPAQASPPVQTPQPPQASSPSQLSPPAPVSSTTSTQPVTIAPSPADTDTSAIPSQTPTIAPVATTPATSAPTTPAPTSPAPASAAPPAPLATAPDTPVSPTVNDDAAATTIAEPAPRAEAVPQALPPVRPRKIPTTPPPTQQVASAEPPIPASNGSYVVQVSSQKSPADAQAAFQSLQRKYGAVLGSMKPSIRKVDLPDRGTYFRVRVGSWSTSAEAASFCAKLKAAGGDCVISRN